jgi:hypothetical protein
MGDPARVAAVRDYCREPASNAEAPLRLGEQHDAAVRSDPPAIEMRR